MQVRASVKVKTPGHEFEGQAGAVVSNDGKDPNESSTVKLDLHSDPVELPDSDLEMLSSN